MVGAGLAVAVVELDDIDGECFLVVVLRLRPAPLLLGLRWFIRWNPSMVPPYAGYAGYAGLRGFRTIPFGGTRPWFRLTRVYVRALFDVRDS